MGVRIRLLALLAPMTVLLAPSAAHANYHMYSCAPPGINVPDQPRGPWAYGATSPSSQIQDHCNLAPGSAQFGISNFNSAMTNNTLSEWRITPPAGTAIVRVHSWAAYNQGCTQGSCAIVNGQDHIEGQRNDYASGGFLSPAFAPAISSYAIRLVCNPGTDCAWITNQPLVIYGTDTELTESTAPSGTIAGGTLLTPGAKSAPASVSYTAADGQSGVERVEALLGDTVVGSESFARDLTQPVAAQTGLCRYVDYAACPTSLARDLQVDPSKAAAGTQQLRLRITDASGNATFVPGANVVVAAGPGAPATPNGTTASREAKLVARYATTRKRSRTLGYHTRPTVRGRLTAKSGQAITGATVVLSARQRATRAPTREIARATTNARGEFQLKAPGGPSRDLVFSYVAFSGDTAPAAASKLRTAVHAKLSASLHPKRPRARAKARVTGKLRYLPRSGVTVVVQARDGKVWRPLGQTKTRSKGRYTFTYRFKRSARGRSLALRAHVDSPNYPFAPSNSNRFKLRVR